MLLTTFGSTTYGQDSNSAPNLTGQIEEILVTATRRTETDILTTPIPMTALNDTMIEKYAPRDLQDMALMTPGLSAGTVSASLAVIADSIPLLPNLPPDLSKACSKLLSVKTPKITGIER